jgi:hypothetical protein
VVSAEHPDQEKREHPHIEHAHKNILGTGARKPNSGDGLSDDLDAMWSPTPTCRARMGNLCGLHPLAPEFAVVWRRRRIFISPRRRRTPGVPRRWFVSCDRDDEFGRLSHGYRQVRLCQAPVALFLDGIVTWFDSSRHGVVFGSSALREGPRVQERWLTAERFSLSAPETIVATAEPSV